MNIMTYIVKIFNVYGGTEIARFEDELACATFAWCLHEKVRNGPELASVTIQDQDGKDVWNEVMRNPA
jgi:hypothetical protein